MWFCKNPITAELICWLSFRYIHRLGGSGSGCWSPGAVLADKRWRPAFQLLAAQTHNEHQKGQTSHISPVWVLPWSLKVVRVPGLWGPGGLSGGSEQREAPNVARWGAGLLLQPLDLQGLQTGSGYVHWLLNKTRQNEWSWISHGLRWSNIRIKSDMYFIYNNNNYLETSWVLL